MRPGTQDSASPRTLGMNMNEKKYVITSDLIFAKLIFQVTVILTVKLINIPFLQND